MNSPTRPVSPTKLVAAQPQRYRVLVSDGFMDADDETELNSYGSFEEAKAVAEQMVERELLHLYRPGMSYERWLEDYMDFGADPWIRPCPVAPDGKPAFSAWRYAEAFISRWNAAPGGTVPIRADV